MRTLLRYSLVRVGPADGEVGVQRDCHGKEPDGEAGNHEQPLLPQACARMEEGGGGRGEWSVVFLSHHWLNWSLLIVGVHSSATYHVMNSRFVGPVSRSSILRSSILRFSSPTFVFFARELLNSHRSTCASL